MVCNMRTAKYSIFGGLLGLCLTGTSLIAQEGSNLARSDDFLYAAIPMQADPFIGEAQPRPLPVKTPPKKVQHTKFLLPSATLSVPIVLASAEDREVLPDAMPSSELLEAANLPPPKRRHQFFSMTPCLCWQRM